MKKSKTTSPKTSKQATQLSDPQLIAVDARRKKEEEEGLDNKDTICSGLLRMI